MPKYEHWMKDKQWLEVIRQLPCLNCGRMPVDAHHVGSRGMGLKNPDSMVIPLCRTCHSSHHDRNDPSLDWCRKKLAWLWAKVARMVLDLGPDGAYKIRKSLDSDRQP